MRNAKRMGFTVAVALVLVLAILLPGCIETRPMQGISTTVNVKVASTQSGICADPNLAICGAFVKEKRTAQNSWLCDGYNGPKETLSQKVSNGANRYIMNISDGWTCVQTSLPPEQKQITELGVLPDCRICYSGSSCKDYFNGDPTCTSYSGWIGHSCYGSTCACSTVYNYQTGLSIKGKVADIHYDYYASSGCGVNDPSAYVTTLSDLPPLPSQGTTASFGVDCGGPSCDICGGGCQGCNMGGAILPNEVNVSLPGYGLRKTIDQCTISASCDDMGGNVTITSLTATTTGGGACTPIPLGSFSDYGSYNAAFNCSRDAIPFLGDMPDSLLIAGGFRTSRTIYGLASGGGECTCCKKDWMGYCTSCTFNTRVVTSHSPVLNCRDTVSCVVSGIYDVNYECTNPYRSQPDGQKIFHFVNCLEGSNFQTFQGGTAYTNPTIPQSQLSSLLSQYTSDPNSKTTIPFFMLGQGPTFSDFEKARSKCNPYEDAKVSLSMGNTTFDPPSMRAQAGTMMCFENKDSKVHQVNITQSGAFVQNLTVGVGGTACGIQLPIGVYTAVDNNSDSSNVVITPRADGTVVYVGKRLTPDYTVVEKGRALVFNYFDDRSRNHTINTTLPTSTGTYSVVIGPSAPTTADDTPPGRRYVANTLGEFIMQDNVTNSKSMVFVASQENVFIFDQVGSANNGLLVAPLVEPGGTGAPYANSSAIVTGSHLARAFGDKVCFTTKVAGITIDIQRERDGDFSTIDGGKLLAPYPDLCCIEDELPGLYRAVTSDGRSVTWLIGSSKPKATVSLQATSFVPDQIDAQPYTSLCLFNPAAIDRTVLVTGPAFSATRKLGAFQSNDCSITLNAEGGYLAKFSPNIGVSAAIGVSAESTSVIKVLDLGFDPPFLQMSPGKDVCWLNTADTPQVLIRTTSSGTQRLPPLKKGSVDCERAIPDGSVISRTQENSNVTSVVTASKNATFFILNGSGIQPPALTGVSGGTLKLINMIDAPVSLYDIEDVELTNNSIGRTSISTITPVTIRFFNTDKRDHLVQMCSGVTVPCAESTHVTVPAGNSSQLGVNSAFEGYMYDSATAQSVVVSVNPLISSLDRKSLAGGTKTIALPDTIAYYMITTSAGNGIAVLTLMPTVPAPTERITMPETLDLPVQKVNYLTSKLLATMRNYSSRGLVPAIVPDFKNVSVDVRTSVFDPQFAETLAGSTVTISNIDNIAHNIGMNKTKEYKYCTSNDPSHFSCIYNGAAGVCETMPNNVAASCDLTVSTTATPYCTNTSDDVICSYNAAGDYCEANATLDFVKVTPSSLCSVTLPRNFETISSGTSATFNDVFLSKGYTSDFIIGTGGTMLKSDDGGSTWSSVNANATAGTNIKAIDFNRNQQGIYVGSDYFYPEQVGYAVGSGGAITKSMDYGRTWSSKPPTAPSSNDWKGGSAFSVVGIGGASLSTSTQGSSWPTTGTTGVTTTLRSVFSKSYSGYETAVGDGGTIIVSTDNGKTWTQKSSPTTENLRAVSSGYELTGYMGDWAVGTHGTIITGKNQWATSSVIFTGGTSAPSAPTMDFTSVSYANSNTGYTCTALGSISKTADGGITWNPLSSGTNSNLFGISFASGTNTGIAVGDAGSILNTADGGTSWSKQQYTLPSTIPNSINSIHFTSASNGFAVGNDGKLYRTYDGGGSWTSVTMSSAGALKSVRFDKNCPNIGWAVGGSYMGRTTDGGNTWTQGSFNPNICFNLDVSINLNDIYMTTLQNCDPTYTGAGGVKTDVGYTVGAAGLVLNTADGGLTWGACEYRFSGARPNGGNTLRGITGTDDGGSIWIVGDGNYIARRYYASYGSGDGYWWQQQTAPSSPGSNIYGVSVYYDGSVAHVYAAGSNGQIYKTDSAPGTGDTWFPKNDNWQALSSGASTSTTFLNIKALNQNMVLATGSGGNIMKISTGPTFKSSVSGTNDLKGLSIVDSNTAYAAGDGGTMYKTSDGGNSWNTVKPSPILKGVSLPSATLGYAAGTSGVIIKTTDGGVTWAKETTPSGQSLNAIASLADGSLAAAVGASGTILTKNSASSTTWTAPAAQTTQDLNAVSVWTTPDNYKEIWAAGNSGALLRYSTKYYSSCGSNCWTSLTSGTTANLYGVTSWASGSYYNTAAVGANGTVIVSAYYIYTGSVTTTIMRTCPGQTLRSVMYDSASKTLYAFGDGGVILKSTNDGYSWNPLVYDTSKDLNGIATDYPYPITGRQVVAVGDGGTIRRYDGYGKWENISTCVKENLNAVTFSYDSSSGTNSFIVVGNRGTILTSGGYGASPWNVISSPTSTYRPTTADLFAVQAVTYETTGSDINSKTGMTVYIVGAAGTILKSTDRGATWTSLKKSDGSAWTTVNLTALYFYTTNIGYVAGDTGLILQTTNGGTTWTITNNPTPQVLPTSDLNGVSLAGPTEVFAVGTGGVILHTTNGGSTWSSQTPAGTSTTLNDITTNVVGNTATIAVGSSGTILTYSGSDAWTKVSVSGVTGTLYGVTSHYDDAGHVIVLAVGDNGMILKSTTAGGSWTQIPAASKPDVGTITLVKVQFGTTNYGNSFAVASGSYGQMFVSWNDGLNWTKLNTGVTNGLYGLGYIDRSGGQFYGATLIAAGTSGIILRGVPYIQYSCQCNNFMHYNATSGKYDTVDCNSKIECKPNYGNGINIQGCYPVLKGGALPCGGYTDMILPYPPTQAGGTPDPSSCKSTDPNNLRCTFNYSSTPPFTGWGSSAGYYCVPDYFVFPNNRKACAEQTFTYPYTYKLCNPAPLFEDYFDNRYTCKYGQASTPTSPNQAPCLLYTMPYLFGWGETRSCDRWQMFKSACSLKSSLLSDFGGVTKCNTMNGDYKCYTDYSTSYFGTQVCTELPYCALSSDWVNDPAGKYCTVHTTTQTVPYTDPILQPGGSLVIPSIRGSDTGNGFGCSGSTCFSYTSLPDLNYTLTEMPTGSNATITVKRLDALIGVGASRLFPTDGDLSPFSAITINNYEKQSRTMNLAFTSTSGATATNSITVPAFGSDQTDQPGTSIVAPAQFLPPNGTGNVTISSALGTTRILVSDVRITRNITVTAAGFGLSTLAADTQSRICFTSADRERKINIYKNGKQVTGGTTFGTATPDPAAHCAMTKNCISTSPDITCTGIQSSTNPDCSYTVRNAQAGCTKSTGTTCVPLRAGISCAYDSTLGKCLFKGDEGAASLVCGASCTAKSPAVDSLLTCSKMGNGCAFQYKPGGEKTSSSNVFCQIFYDVNGLLCRPTGAYSDIGCTSKRTGALTPDMTNCYLTPPPAASGSTLVSNEYCNVQWEKVTIASGPCAGSYYNATSCSVNKGGSAMPDSMYPVSCTKVSASPIGCGLNTCAYSTSPQPPYACTSDSSCPCMKCGKSPDFSFAPNIGCTPTSEGCKVNTTFAVDTSGVCAVSQGTACTPNYDGVVCGVDSGGNCQMQAKETPDTGLVKYCAGDPSGCESFDQNLNCTFIQTTDPKTGQTSKNCTVSSFQPSYCWDFGDEGNYIIEDATTLKTMIINRFNKNQQLNIDLMRSYVIPDAVNTSPGSQVCFFSSDGGTHNLTTSDGRAMKVGPSDVCTCTRPSCIIYGPSNNYNYYADGNTCRVVGWVTQGICPHPVLSDPCNLASSTYMSCQDAIVVYGNAQDKIGDPFTLDSQFNPRNCTTSASCTNVKDCQNQGNNWWLMCKGLDAYGRPYGSSYPEYCPLNATPPWSTTFAPGLPYTMYLGMFRQVEGPCLETSCSALAKYCPPFPESDRPYYITVSDPEFVGASATITSSTQNVTINVYQKTFDPEYGLIRPDGTLTFNNKDLISHTIYRTDTETGTARYNIPSSTPDPAITVLSETAFACDGSYGSNGDRIKLQLSLPTNTIALSVTSAFNDNGQIYFNGYTVPGTAHTRCVDKVHVLSSPSTAQVPTNYINQLGSTTNNVTIELCSCSSTDRGNLSVSFLYTYLNPQKLGNVTIGTIKPEESLTLANLPLGQKAYFVQDGKGAFNLQVKTCEGSDMNDMAGKINSYERQDYAPPTNTICDSGGQTGCSKYNPYGPSTIAILTTEQGLNFSNPNDVQCAKDEVTSIKSTCQRCTSAINVGEANRSVVKTLLDDAKARGSTDLVARTVLLNNMPNCTFSDLMDSIINDSKFSLYTYQKPSIILDFGLKSGSNKAGTCSWTNETIGKAYDDLFLLWTPQLAGAGIIGLSQTCYSDPCPLLNYYGFYTENGAAKDYTDAWFKKGCGGYYYNSEGLTMTTFGMNESQYVACDPSKVFAMLQGFLCTINSTGITIPR